MSEICDYSNDAADAEKADLNVGAGGRPEIGGSDAFSENRVSAQRTMVTGKGVLKDQPPERLQY